MDITSTSIISCSSLNQHDKIRRDLSGKQNNLQVLIDKSSSTGTKIKLPSTFTANTEGFSIIKNPFSEEREQESTSSKVALWGDIILGQRTQNDIGSTIHSAAQDGDFEELKFLYQNGANLEEKTLHGRTPLHIAALNGKCEAVRYLLDQNVDIYVLDSQGFQAKDLAANNGHLTVLQTLLHRHGSVFRN